MRLFFHYRDFFPCIVKLKRLIEHIDVTSRHAFETARITQSFAAGWFNKYANKTLPADEDINNFLRIAFGKLREELWREEKI